MVVNDKKHPAPYRFANLFKYFSSILISSFFSDPSYVILFATRLSALVVLVGVIGFGLLFFILLRFVFVCVQILQRLYPQATHAKLSIAMPCNSHPLRYRLIAEPYTGRSCLCTIQESKVSFFLRFAFVKSHVNFFSKLWCDCS